MSSSGTTPRAEGTGHARTGSEQGTVHQQQRQNVAGHRRTLRDVDGQVGLSSGVRADGRLSRVGRGLAGRRPS